MPTISITGADTPLQAEANLLVDKINYANGSNILYTDFVFGLPTPYAMAGVDANTQITMTPSAYSNFYGDRTIYYNRMDLGVILNNSAISITAGTNTLLSQLIPAINLAYGINLTSIDYTDQTITPYNPANPDVQASVMIEATSTSLLFTGSYNLNLGPAPQQPVNGVVRATYILINGLTTTAGITSNILAIDDNGNALPNFALIRNATSVTTFSINAIHPSTTGTVVLDGTFAFTAAVGSNPSTAITASSLVLDPTGTIISYTSTGAYGSTNAAFVAGNPNQAVKYVIDAGTSLGSNSNKVYQYNNVGVINGSWSATGISYVPSILALCDNGNIYTVSGVLPSPNQVRIDRLLPTGALDTTFTPVIITASTSNGPLIPIQIKPVNGAGFWLVFNTPYGASTAFEIPVINGAVLSIAETGALEHAFNPVFRFAESGSWSTAFQNNLPNNMPNSIFSNTNSNIQTGDHVLAFTGTQVTNFTNRQNPINGYYYRAPITFDTLGNQLTLSGTSYSVQYRWIDARNIVPLSNGKYIAYGQAYLPVNGGGWTVPTPIVGRYQIDGEIDQVLYTQPIVGGVTTPTIAQVIITETPPAA